MSVLVVGMSHRSAPVALLERLIMDDRVQADTTTALVDQPSLSEAMIISTCNRLEVYAVTSSFHSGVEDVLDVLAQTSGVDEEELRSYSYVRHADAAAEHMMTVASGLDSMVVGEQQIIGQLRASYQDAAEHGTVGPGLHSLAQSALRTGKRVHSETQIDDAGASMVTFALDEVMATMGVDNLHGKTALVLGAGAMASLSATHLGKRGIDKLIIANRTRERAERLAEHSREAGVPAEVVDFEDRAQALSRVDIAFSATASDDYTITPADVTGPVVLADLSLPRDIDDAVTARDDVHLVNIEYLHSRMELEHRGDTATRKKAEQIVAEEVNNFTSRQRVREVGPAVAQLRKATTDIADAELERLRPRLTDVSDEDFNEVTRAVHRMVDKILHTPTVRIKELAAKEESLDIEKIVDNLFGLGGRSVAIEAQRLPKLTNTKDES